MTASPGERLIRAGLVVAAAGMAVTLLAMAPLVADVVMPAWMWALSMSTGIGFALVLAGLAQRVRMRARTQVGARSGRR